MCGLRSDFKLGLCSGLCSVHLSRAGTWVEGVSPSLDGPFTPWGGAGAGQTQGSGLSYMMWCTGLPRLDRRTRGSFCLGSGNAPPLLPSEDSGQLQQVGSSHWPGEGAVLEVEHPGPVEGLDPSLLEQS